MRSSPTEYAVVQKISLCGKGNHPRKTCHFQLGQVWTSGGPEKTITRATIRGRIGKPGVTSGDFSSKGCASVPRLRIDCTFSPGGSSLKRRLSELSDGLTRGGISSLFPLQRRGS